LRLGARVYVKVERLLFERPMLTSQVMTSFLIVAFFTIFLAFFPAFEEFKDWLISLRPSEDTRSKDKSHRFTLSRTRIFMTPFPRNSEARNQPTSPEQNLEEQTHGMFSRVQQIRNQLQHHSHSQRLDFSPSTQKVLALLHPVSDIQVITGLAIIVAGIGQWDHISFYHEQLISSYYGLTLNSFWAARISFMNVDADDDIWVMFVRRASILVSCILNVVWQFRIYYHENNGAWNDDGGPCYRFLDRSSPFFGLVFWNMGQIIFCIALASCMFEQTRWINELYFAITERFLQFLWDWFKSTLGGYSNPHPQDSCSLSIFRRLVQGIWAPIEVVIAGLCTTFWFLLLQLLAVWSYGDGFYPLTWLAYLGFYTWNALDIISLVVLNHHMIGEEEWTWGFGQILPVVLILSIIFYIVDVYRGKWTRLLLFPFMW
jgi:preprotein translocase subunit SecE